MKANPIQSAAGKGPFHGHEIQLSIGMIVKNEEAVLDRCLRSLQPLLEAVPSELIITDTGSTDRTVEIARKYTDNILFFEWCDDFSAARNTGLKAARGEWFMFLDADEWFENADWLIEFFTSGECDKYGSAAYTIRSFSNVEKTEYSEFYATRLYRTYEGIHFEYIVHENIRVLDPTKYLADCAYHDGYVFSSEAEKHEKANRNLKLLEQVMEKNPFDLRTYYQRSKQYFLIGNKEAAEKYSRLGLQVEKNHPAPFWRAGIQHNLCLALYVEEKNKELLEFVEELSKTEPETEIYWLDYHGYAQSAAFILHDYEKSVFYGEAYWRTYEQYRNGALERSGLLLDKPLLLNPQQKINTLYLLVINYLALKTPERAEKILDRFDLSEKAEREEFLKLAVRICEKEEKWTLLPFCFQKACAALEKATQMVAVRELEAVLSQEKEERQSAFAALAGLPEDGDPYVRLCRLRCAEEGEDREAALRELNWFFQRNETWEPLFSDVLFFAMKEKVNIMPLILKIDAEDLKYYAVAMQSLHSDLTDVIRGYSESYSFENIRGLYWSVCLREKVVLAKDDSFESKEDEIGFFEEYARQVAKYVRALYRPEALSSDRLSVLPRAHRFGWYMGLALSARDCSDGEAYLSNLRLALEVYPVMTRPVSLLLDRFEREELQKQKKADEFRSLAKQVKENIQRLIAEGKLEEAGRFTAQLAALMPDDEDIVRFRTLTHTEPGMDELVSQLPQ